MYALPQRASYIRWIRNGSERASHLQALRY
jgi:hypothetical protein